MASMLESPESMEASSRRRKSMDPVSEYIRVEELPDPIDRFVLQERLRTGSTYILYSGFDKEKGKKVAVKVIENMAESILEIEAEFRVLSKVGGKFLVPDFYGAFLARPKESAQELWFVMEPCDGVLLSDFRNWLRKERKSLNEEEISILIKSMLIAIERLHSNEIMHRDIRASNFLLGYNGEMKVMDFGFCAFLKEKKLETHSAVGSPHWMAPEVITSENISSYSKNCDVWSLGITAIELAEGHPPLSSSSSMQAMLQTVRYPPPTLSRPENWSDMFKDFVNECLTKCPDSRPCAAELLFHPFITGTEEEKTLHSVEEYLNQEMEPKIGCKGKEVLKRLGRLAAEMAEFHTTDAEDVIPIVKNFYLKKGPGSRFIRMLPDDATFLDNISEECLSELLHQRYLQDEVYTYVADILVAINPKRDISLFKPEKHMDYCDKPFKENKPHIFAIADRAYRQMLHHESDQTVIFLGESGSGKSTSMKNFMNHLAFLATTESRNDIGGKIKQIVMILDSFGGTYRTECFCDTSRHFKTISVTFAKTGKVSGAFIDAMLLDDWRLPCKVMLENNYHVFYYIYEGLRSENRLNEFNLEKLNEYRYLPQREKRKKENAISVYKSILNSLVSFSFENEEIQAIFSVISSILLLGEINFTENEENVQIMDESLLETACELAQLNSEVMKSILTCVSSIDEAQARREGLALCLYSCLFERIVEALNQKMAFSRLVFGHDYSIHVLDNPGFFTSGNDDLYRITSNVLSDLQQKVLRNLIFSKELEQYKEEAVDLPFVCENHPLIHSWNYSGDGSDLMTIITAIRNNQERDIHSFVSATNYARKHEEDIVIKHIFGETQYNLQKIRGKKMTFDDSELASAVNAIPNTFIASIFEKLSTGTLPSAMLKFPLDSLNSVIEKEFPHIIISLNPDGCCLSGERVASQSYIIQQIRAFSLTEVALIRQQGYARRISFHDFLARYKHLAFDFNEDVQVTEDNCRLLLIRLRMDGWKTGKTKVFLKYYAAEYLSQLYEEHVKKIIKVQSTARRFIVRIRRKFRVQA